MYTVECMKIALSVMRECVLLFKSMVIVYKEISFENVTNCCVCLNGNGKEHSLDFIKDYPGIITKDRDLGY